MVVRQFIALLAVHFAIMTAGDSELYIHVLYTCARASRCAHTSSGMACKSSTSTVRLWCRWWWC